MSGYLRLGCRNLALGGQLCVDLKYVHISSAWKVVWLFIDYSIEVIQDKFHQCFGVLILTHEHANSIKTAALSHITDLHLPILLFHHGCRGHAIRPTQFGSNIFESPSIIVRPTSPSRERLIAISLRLMIVFHSEVISYISDNDTIALANVFK
jgi:hypothetical protein